MTELNTARPDFTVDTFRVLEVGVSVEVTRWPGATDMWVIKPEGISSAPWRHDLFVTVADDVVLVEVAKRVCRILQAYRAAIDAANKRMQIDVGTVRDQFMPAATVTSTPVAAESPA